MQNIVEIVVNSNEYNYGSCHPSLQSIFYPRNARDITNKELLMSLPEWPSNMGTKVKTIEPEPLPMYKQKLKSRFGGSVLNKPNSKYTVNKYGTIIKVR